MRVLIPILLSVCLPAWGGGARADVGAVELVTPTEAAQASKASVGPRTRSLLGSDTVNPMAPRILIDNPSPYQVVRSPTPIRIRFQAVAGSRILPETFQVLYGPFSLDVTSRILARFAASPDGINVEEATLPSGRHIFTVRIADDAHRVGSRRLEVRVAE